jgi:hypothetical protein
VTMDPVAVADYVVPASGAEREEPFLLARLVCDQLIARPVDTTQPGWQSRVAGSVFEALDAEIDAVAAPAHRVLSPTGSAGLARQLLTALTWGFGAGLPETEWVAVATALSVELMLSWVLPTFRGCWISWAATFFLTVRRVRLCTGWLIKAWLIISARRLCPTP